MVTLAWVAVAVGLVLNETVTSLATAATAGAEAVTFNPALVSPALTAAVTFLSVSYLVKPAASKALSAVSDG